jgi:hypothetical protein
MGNPVFLEFDRKPALASPVGVLPPAVGQHFLWRGVFTDRDAVRFNHRFGRRASVQVQVHNVA